jgi:lycopene cyclase domain-containing protein
MFIYECLVGYFPNLPLNGKWTNLIMAGLTTTIAAYNYDRLYTFITFGLIGITLWYLIVFKSAIINKIQQHLFPAWLLSIIPMLYVNDVLTSKPVLIYNNLENLGIRIGSIPFEDFFYNYLYMLWMVIIFENLRLRNTNSNLAK